MKFLKIWPLEKILSNIIVKINYQIKMYNDWSEFKTKHSFSRFTLLKKDRIYYYLDATRTTEFDHHYVYHLAWAARLLAQTRPTVHYELSSSLYFCTMVSAFVPIKFFDYRPVKINLSNFSSDYADITCLPFKDGSIQSLSCMHTVEHIGLGRYGDPIDPDGDLKAIAEIKRVLSNRGNLFFVVPIGKDAKIMFNAHRIYTYDQITTYFKDFEIVEFSLITNNPNMDDFIENADPKLIEQCTYGCGCFWFRK